MRDRRRYTAAAVVLLLSCFVAVAATASDATPDAGVDASAVDSRAAPTNTADATAAAAGDASAAGDADGSVATDALPPDAALPDWAPKLTATVKPAVVSLGDPVTVTLKVHHGPGVSVTLPLRLELGKFVELSRQESTKKTKAKGKGKDKATTGATTIERTFVVKVAAYDLGEVTLPAMEVTALGPQGELLSLKTTSMPIRVKSLMGNEPKPKLEALAPPVSVFQRDLLLLYILIGVGAAAVIVVGTLLVSRELRARRLARQPPPPPTPPHVIALRRLGEIDLNDYIGREAYKELYLLLSEILRGYIGGRFGFDAMEMTTSEIRQAMRERRVDAATRERVDEICTSWDLVKFAKYQPSPEGAREAFADAEGFVRETMQTVLPKQQPAAASGATTVEAQR